MWLSRVSDCRTRYNCARQAVSAQLILQRGARTMKRKASKVESAYLLVFVIHCSLLPQKANLRTEIR